MNRCETFNFVDINRADEQKKIPDLLFFLLNPDVDKWNIKHLSRATYVNEFVAG